MEHNSLEVWNIMFLSKWLICRFHVHLPGCIPLYLLGIFMNSCSLSSIYFFVNLRCGPEELEMQGLAEYSQAALLGFWGRGREQTVVTTRPTRHPDLLDLSTGALPNKTKGWMEPKVSNHWFVDVCGVGTKRIQTKNGCSKTHNSFSMQANCVMGFLSTDEF